MPRSARVHPDHQPALTQALQQHGFLTQGSLAVHLELALSTVSNFFRGVNVSISKFEQISETLGLEAGKLILPRDRRADGAMGSSETREEGSPSASEVLLPALAVFAYDSAWSGRKSLIQALHQRLRENCRLLLLTGLSGIGKTALAERLFVEESQHGQSIPLLRENFDSPEQATDFASVAARLLEKCGQLVLPTERLDTLLLTKRLLRCLQENPYWLIVDSLEEILQGNEHEGWSEFKDNGFVPFFQAVLAAETFQSRLILTSQELPSQITEVGTRYRNFWHNQPLSGLTEAEQLELFEKTGLEVTAKANNRSYLVRLGTAYEGHPLALRVIAGEIGSQPFYGQVKAYWNKYGHEIEAIEQAIAAAQVGNVTGADDRWQLDRFSRLLRQNVRSRLEKTFTRLRNDVKPAYLLLCEASVYRCAVPEDWWLSHLDAWHGDDSSKQAVLEALRERYLVEESISSEQYLLRQHHLIRSMALEHLKHLDLCLEGGDT